MRLLDPGRLRAVVAPMGVWALHFVVVYSLVGVGCQEHWHRQMLGGASLLKWLLVLVTILSLGAIAAFGWRAWRRRSQRRDARGDPGQLQSRHNFMDLAATVLSIIAAIAVTFTATPIFLLPFCT